MKVNKRKNAGNIDMNTLLQRIDTIQKQFQTENKPQYNVFSVLGIQSKEVLLCRIIADFLDPSGAHGQGTAFLQSFLETVLKISDISQESYQYARVTTEYVISPSDVSSVNNRRIDIVIQIGKRFIPVEVKVYAGDQNSQCYDYYQYARKLDASAKIYYLTPYGNEPSEISTSRGEEKIPANDLVMLSFQRDIPDWLAQCVLACESDSVKEILEQLKGSIEAITERHNREVIQMTAEELASSKENLEAGILISDALDDAKAMVLRDVLAEFEKQMEPLISRYSLERETSCKWYEYPECATRNFFHGESTYPGINYVVKGISLPNDYQLWFRIEVEWNLFAGFCVFDPKNKKEVRDLSGIQKELNSCLNISLSDTDGWWAEWYYLPNGKTKEDNTIPNFRNMNAAARSLADESTRTEFVKQCIKTIEEVLLHRMEKRNDKTDEVERG